MPFSYRFFEAPSAHLADCRGTCPKKKCRIHGSAAHNTVPVRQAVKIWQDAYNILDVYIMNFVSKDIQTVNNLSENENENMKKTLEIAPR